MSKKTINLTREASVSLNADNSNIVDVIFSTGASVKRYDFFNDKIVNESLEMTPEACDLSRLNTGAPVCNSHNTYDLNDVLGVVVKNSATIENGIGRCQVELSNRENIYGLVSDIKSGIIKNVSIGYRALEYENTTSDEDTETQILVTSWQPHEISFVSVPADQFAQSNRKFNDGKSTTMATKEIETTTVEKNTTMELERANKEAQDKIVELEKARAEAEAKIKENQERTLNIIKRCKSANISEDKQREFIESDKPMAEISEMIIDEYERKNEKENDQINRSYITSTCNNDNLVRDLTDALVAKSQCKKSDNENANQFRHYTMLEVAGRMFGAGASTTHMSKSELAARALTTSDFKLLLGNVANKTLQRAYQQAPQTFRPFIREVPITDFKPVQRTRLGDAPNMPVVAEGAEFTYGAVGEEAETYKLATYGRIIPLTRQALINDDLSAFTRLAEKQGYAAARVESKLVWGILADNANMSDGNKLFSAKHKNLKLGANKMDEATVSAVRKSFRTVRSVDGELIDLNARYIITNSDLQTQAEKFISTNLLANQVSDINVFSGQFEVISEPLLDDIDKKPFFMFADPMYIDVIELGYLDGNNGVYLESQEKFSTDVVEYKARLDVAAAPIDWRGMYQINTIA